MIRYTRNARKTALLLAKFAFELDFRALAELQISNPSLSAMLLEFMA